MISASVSGEAALSVESGAADIEQDKRITHNTVFHIASLSKQITGAALALAILDNKVSLEHAVSDWLPETAMYGDKLKIKHLVYMTSGLTEYTGVKRLDQKPWATFHYFSTDDAIRSSLSVKQLSFEPGSKWEYANINYMLIAKIVEKAYQSSFSEVVKDKLFTPLGMTASLINDDITQLIPNRANAYLERSSAVLNELNGGAKIYAGTQGDLVMIRRNSPHYGGSGVMTSMNDWMKWQSELLTGDVLGKEFLKLMLSTMTFKHNKHNDAFGLVHGNYQGKPTWWYEGSDIDGSSYSITFPNIGLTISCFSNNPLNNCRAKAQSLITIINNNGWVN